jgi:hypothetical protein
MPQTPRRPTRSARQPKARKSAATSGQHVHDSDSKLSSFTYRGRSVDVHAGEHGCCVVIDGERVDYMVEPDGIYSHEMAYQKFGSPEELAEEVIRQWGQAKIDRTPVPHDHEHDHDDNPH